MKSFALMFSSAAATYDESQALLHANLVTAAYCGYPKTSQASFEAWDCGPACDAVEGMTDVKQIWSHDKNDAFAFVGKLQGECVLAFRGTSDLAGWISDLSSLDLVDLTGQGVTCNYNGKPCLVGDGFMRNYNSIATFVKGNLSAIGCTPGYGITVTGHSLGASEAQIAMYDLRNAGYKIKPTYTFGQPRTGDNAFKQAFEQDLGASLSYRVTHYHDPIPHLPMENILAPGRHGFVHTSTEVFYREKVSDGYTVCNGSGEDHSCSDSFTDTPYMVTACLGGGSHCDHLTYMMPTKPTVMDGTSCTNGMSSEAIV